MKITYTEPTCQFVALANDDILANLMSIDSLFDENGNIIEG